jgi:hypothetical protein
MSEDDVYPGEMDTPHEFDDQAAEALLSGSDRGTDPQLDDLFDDMRVAYTSQPPAVGAELAAVLAEAELTQEASPTRRFERMRSSIVARAGAATAAVLAATGGLAVAHALPASMQDAASGIGIGAPAHRGHDAHEAVEVEPEHETSTTIAGDTSTTVPDHGNEGVEHGDDNDQGAVGQHDGDDNDDQGENECEADEQGEVEHDGEVTSTSVPCVPTTETTVAESHDGNDDSEHSTVTTVPEANDDNSGSSDSAGPGSGGDEHTTTPTTTTSHSGDGGDDSHSGSGSGSDDGGSSHGG